MLGNWTAKVCLDAVESVKMSIDDISAALHKKKADARLASLAVKFASMHSSV